MYRPIQWILVLFLAVLTHPQVRAEPSPMLHNPNNTKVPLPFSLVATATATRPVIVGQGSSTASPSTAPGGLFLSVEIPSTGGGISMDNASLTVSALCTGSAIEPLQVGPIQIYIGTQPARTTASLFVNVELPWDGGRKELADADYYLERSYSCTATVQLNTSSLRSKKVTTNAIVWNVLVAEQAAKISTLQPTNGNEMHSATFQAASLDSTAPTTPVTVGIPPGTRATVDGQTPPLGSPVNISFDQPLGADIPGGSEMPPLVAPVVRVGPEAASFDEAVVLGLTPSGPLAEIEAPVPITYDEGVQDWVDCQQDGSCQEIPCPDAEGFEPGMVCIEVYHFSLWSLGSDKQWVIQIELMTDDGKATATPWKCSQGSLCPTGMVGRLVYEHPADTATRKARIRVCIPAGEEQTCNGGTLVKGLKDWGTPGCFSGGKCPFTGGAVSEDSGNPGNYYIDLFQLTLTGWGSLQVSVEAEDVTGLPKATLDVLSTSCSGDTSHQDSTTLYDCLNLGIKPKLDKATLDTSNKTLTVLTTSSFTGSTNLKSGTLALYPADATQCSNTWNPATAGVTGLSIQTASLTATSAIATTSLTTMANVRAQLATSTYGTVLGPCIPVTILGADVDKDGFTVTQGDCNDTDASVHPSALEYPGNGKDDDCDGVESDIVEVAGGGYHSLALDDLGRVWAWGRNNYGQLGDGTSIDRTFPVQVSGLPKIVALAGGYLHSLAVDDQGRVWAWGSNSLGQLGDGTKVSHTSPVQVLGLSGTVAVTAGNDMSVAVDNQGQVWTWGSNNAGQLGDGTTTVRTSPVPVSGLGGVVAVTGGWSHVLALDNVGRVWAWGYNYYGQLGDGTTTNRASPVLVPGLGGMLAVTGGNEHSVAVDSQGRAWAWGSNRYGQLGDGTTTNRTSPVQVPGLSGVKSVTGGGNDSLAYDGQGRVWAWGRNNYGQLGDGTTTDRTRVVQVVGLVEAIAVAGGEEHSLALDNQGRVWAWGANYFGQLGDETLFECTSPASVPGMSGLVAVAGGNLHSLAADNQGRIWAWGYNGYGQLGDGTTDAHSSPVQLPIPSVMKALAGGYTHSLALDTHGWVWAWGYNVYGQLGDGTTTNRTGPVQVPGLGGIVAIAGGWNHSIAIDDQGRAWTWGYNNLGQLGDGTTTNRISPFQIPGLSGLIAGTGGGSHSLAVDNQGRAWAWGANYVGQLGDGTTSNRTSPVQVSGLSGVRAVAGGGTHSLALDNLGRVWAWGSNGYGQLGDGTTTDRTRAVQIPGLSGIVAVAGGYSHSLALDNQGRVWAWGGNQQGQLGDGTTTNRLSPVQGPGMTGVKVVAGGGTHSLTVRADLTLATWGANDSGELGIGVDSWSPQPVVWGP